MVRDRLRVPTAEDICNRRERCALGRHDYEAVLRSSAQAIFMLRCVHCGVLHKVPWELWREMVYTQELVKI